MIIIIHSLNQVDLQKMMDKKRDKIAPHKSKFVKQVFYYAIVVILQIRLVKWIYSLWMVCCFCCLISLSIYVIVVLTTNGEKTIKLVDSSGMAQDIPSYKVLATLGIGWAAFGLSLIFNILYYALHPSQVTLITLICLLLFLL